VPQAKHRKKNNDVQSTFYAADAPVVTLAMGCNPHLSDIVDSFWQLKNRVVFSAVAEEIPYFALSDDYYVTQMQISAPNARRAEPVIALLRISQGMCANLLEQTLGSRQEANQEDDFDFRRMSPLEASILSEFSKEILIAFRKKLIAPIDNQTALSGEEIHLLWTVELQPKDEKAPKLPLGSVIFTLPPEALKVPKASQEAFLEIDDDFFYHISLPFSFYIGAGKMPLSDVHQLETGDIVVLETSSIDCLYLIEPGTGKHLSFLVMAEQVRKRSPLSLPAMQESFDMENPERGQEAGARKSLWDNLMIDVSAEFDPVRVPLQQLKQMTTGVVVEIGDLLHNQVSLQVEGRTLARGELVVVGDKFAVRVINILSDENVSEANSKNKAQSKEAPPPETMSTEAQSVQPENQEEAPAEEYAEEEDDLDDFLEEDFDEEPAG
jgi:flagellar motor switch/type III secretory pathway protein FliN